MNMNDETQRGRLFRAMEHSYRQLEPFRTLTRGLVREYAGSGYGQNTTNQKEILVNLMNQAVDAYTMALVANRPRVLITAKQPELEFFAKKFQEALNNLIQEINLEYTFRNAVLDAFFCVGVVKVHLAESVPVMVEEGLWMDPGLPFVSNVSLDNFVFDTSATEWQNIKFAADSYRIPFEDLKGDIFNQSVVSQLKPTSKGNEEEDRLEQISTGRETDEDEFEPMIDLMDVWIPRDNKIYTFAMDHAKRFIGRLGPVAEMDWDGPEFGPYKLLSFNDVPENIMPTSPAAHLAGLSRLANNLIRKQKRQAMRQKDVGVYAPGAEKDSQRVNAADDGEDICVNDPKDIGTIKRGGVDAGNHAFFLGIVEMFDRMAGNLTAMMGLGPQADTLGQEQLIHGAVSKKEAQMQYRTVDFACGVLRDLGHLLWADAVKVIPGRVEIDGADGYSVDATWTPDERHGDFSDYDFNIDVYSMPYQSPVQRLQALNLLITQIYSPLASMMASQGGQINLQKLTNIYAELLNEPRLKEIIQFAAVSAQAEGDQEGPGMSPSTTRNYVRRSIPTGGTPQSRSRVAQSEWINMAGQNNQNQSAAAAAV